MFRVRWEEAAENELTTLWTDAESALRQLITETVSQIDRQLEADPLAQSESRSEGRRILFSSPLGILYRIEADGQTVTVLPVWLFQIHGK
jgi:plasmid stabilization system protein ParE